MRIWKYVLRITDLQTLEVPTGAKFLDVQMQNDVCCLWALISDEDAALEKREIAIYGTGNPIPDSPGSYIATFQLVVGLLVFHVFEIKKESVRARF